MRVFFSLEPEVAGGFGSRTVIDRSSGKMNVQHLHYEFDGWLGDELLESAPCYIVSERMAQAIKANGLTGVEFADVEITVSSQFRVLYPDRQLPRFLWLKVNGVPLRDDFGIGAGLKLVVSEQTLQALQRIGIRNAIVENA